MNSLTSQKEAVDLVLDEVEQVCHFCIIVPAGCFVMRLDPQRRDEVQIQIREMFSKLRLAVKRRQRYMERRAGVVIELKRKRTLAFAAVTNIKV